MRTKNLVKYIAVPISCLLLFTGIASAEMSDEEFAKKFAVYLESEKGKELLGGAVESYFKEKQDNARKAQADRQKADLEQQFKNPIKIPVGNSPVKGPADAKVTIVEFSDFQCPYCTKGMKVMEEILKAYPKDVRIVFKNLPLPFHKQAEPAARAALAAGKQGKFWEMHDALFENQKKLNSAFYEELATKLGLNMDQFKKDYESEDLKKAVKDDAELAKEHGIRGTPGFFVNGVAVKGAYPFDHFKGIIDRWLSQG
jgi:protein-disulfide isomerase